MKTSSLVIALLASMVVGSFGQTVNTPTGGTQSKGGATTLPADTDYTVTERGANHRIWQRTTCEQGPNGKVIPHVHQYTELATGMHYKDAKGQWAESQELIEAYPGGAVARQGQHQVIFANNLNSRGAIDMQTPAGQRLRSNILGLMYVDAATGDAVLIARLQDSEGQLISGNQVLYPNAFEGVKADVQYTYRRAGFEQDVILREQPPAPESFGMDPATTELEVFTEFINPPEASVKDNAADNGLEADQEIGWGDVMLGRGKAFNLGDQTTQAPVTKRYVKIQGRYFLAEKVPLKDILPAISKLPEQAANPVKLPVMAFKSLTLPKTPLARSGASPMRLASSSLPDKGYVLDYVTVNASLTNYTFQGDTTYYVSGALNLYGTTTIEGGAVLKYATNGMLNVYGSINCQTAPYRPGVLTAKDDNSVGETVSGSTGTPSGYYGCSFSLMDSTPKQLHDLRISHAGTVISVGWAADTNSMKNVQLYHVGYAINAYHAGGWNLQNLLIARVGTVIGASTATIRGEHWTVDQANTICSGTTLYLTNSLLSSITNMGSFTSVNNVTNSSGSGVFQTVGGGAYYLTTNSSYRNAGTTNIAPTLLADLRQKTTFPPIVYSNITLSVATTLSPQAQRDTDTPDLGYHYDPLDYIFGASSVTRSNLTFSAGTAVGFFFNSAGGSYALAVGDSAAVAFNGTAKSPCRWSKYNTVQEGANGNWKSQSWLGGITGQSFTYAAPAVRANFTIGTALANDSNLFRDNWTLLNVCVTNCEFWSGGVAGYYASLNLVNCLFVNDNVGLWQNYGAANITMRGCTMIRGYFFAAHSSSGNWPVSIVNSAFDKTVFNMTPNSYGTNGAYFDYNSFLQNSNRTYLSGSHDLTITNGYNWQSSWFGNYYQLTNSPLINKGSTTANLVGLYHFTTQANQVKEAASTVDIGYHYIATDAYGKPVDTDGAGQADYREDANGNGLTDNGEAVWGIPPTITARPTTKWAMLADDVIFSVSANGVPTLGYQWYFNGTALTWQTNATLEFNNVQYSNAGIYSVTVVNSQGSTNIAVTLYVNAPYYTVLSGALTNYLFQGDTTYYINSTVQLYGCTTIEGGAVIKYANHATSKLVFNGPLISLTEAYRPAMLTSRDDDSVGFRINCSSGNPSSVLTASYLVAGSGQTNAYQNLHVKYAATAICATNLVNVWDSQFFKCGTAVANTYTGTNSNIRTIALHNVLVAQGSNCVATMGTVMAEFLTADQCRTFCPVAYGGARLTNSILTGVTNSTGVNLISSITASSRSGLYQVVGGGHYYLATNTFQAQGTTNVSPDVLTDISAKTTCPPVYYYIPGVYLSTNLNLFPQARRDTNAAPDLGYHYPPLDYILSPIFVTNATITINAGTAVGFYGVQGSYNYGISLSDNSKLICQGKADERIQLLVYNLVQEQTPTNWTEPYYGLATRFAGTEPSQINSRFTDWSSFAQDVSLISMAGNGLHNFQHCQFHGGQIYSWNPTLNFVNCLLERVYSDIEPGDTNTPAFRNNLVYGGEFYYYPWVATNAVITDNLFDHAQIDNYCGPDGITYIGGHNAYITGCQRLIPDFASDIILSASPNYQVGPLGRYYLPADSSLIDAGSTTAALAGLYHFTSENTLADGLEFKEAGSAVNIGYHYVAVNYLKTPLDLDNNGIPDYLEVSQISIQIIQDAIEPGYIPTTANCDDYSSTYFGQKGVFKLTRTGNLSREVIIPVAITGAGYGIDYNIHGITSDERLLIELPHYYGGKTGQPGVYFGSGEESRLVYVDPKWGGILQNENVSLRICSGGYDAPFYTLDAAQSEATMTVFDSNADTISAETDLLLPRANPLIPGDSFTGFARLHRQDYNPVTGYGSDIGMGPFSARFLFFVTDAAVGKDFSFESTSCSLYGGSGMTFKNEQNEDVAVQCYEIGTSFCIGYHYLPELYPIVKAESGPFKINVLHGDGTIKHCWFFWSESPFSAIQINNWSVGIFSPPFLSELNFAEGAAYNFTMRNDILVAGAPVITSQPQSQTVIAGADVTITLVASGDAPLTYKWYHNGVIYATTTVPSQTLNGVAANHAGIYRVEVSNTKGSATSLEAVLHVTPFIVPPTITAQPQEQSALVNHSANFTVTATGSTPMSYQWHDENGIDLNNGDTTLGGGVISGADTATLSLTGVQLSDSGHSYYVTIANAIGTVDSAHASLSVANPVPPVIVTQPAGRTTIVGADVTFKVTVLSAPQTHYVWLFDGGTIASAGDSPSLTLHNVQPMDAGKYSVVVVNPYGSITSADANLAVKQVPLLPVMFSPANSGTLPVKVSLSVPGHSDAVIHYTIDGTTPTASSPVYSTPLVLGAQTTVSAYATKTGFIDSGVTAQGFGSPLDPVVVPDVLQADQNSTDIPLDVLANDTDPQQLGLTITVITTPVHGTVSQSVDGTVLYTPNADFCGMDVFSYSIEDGLGATATAAVTVFVNQYGNGNPNAVDDAATLGYNISQNAYTATATINLLANDTDPDGDALAIYSVGQPTMGSVAITGDGQITYTRGANKFGADSFTYTITDGNGGYATATVTIDQVDSDNDGMPDEWEVAHGLNPADASDAMADPDGDGLPNLAEYHLHTDPHNAVDNPLVIPVANGSTISGEWKIQIPLSSEVDASESIQLLVNGDLVDQGIVEKSDDGLWWLTLATACLPNGNYILQLKYTYPESIALNMSEIDQSILGSQSSVIINNPVTIDELSSAFSSELYIKANVNVPADTYIVDLYNTDDLNTKIWTLTGNVVGGRIDTQWDLTDGNQNVIAPDDIQAVIRLSTQNSVSSQGNPVPHAAGSSTVYTYGKEPGDLPDRNFVVSYGLDNYGENSSDINNAQRAMVSTVVDSLCNVGLDNSYWLLPPGNSWDGYAFHLDSAEHSKLLLDSLTSGDNFIYMGHGGNNRIGNNQGGFLNSKDTANALGYGTAKVNKHGNKIMRHPYRLVILDGCKTYSAEWTHAFGVPFISVSSEDFQRCGRAPRAFVGMSKEVYGLGNGCSYTDWRLFLSADQALTDDWMGGMPLSYCMADYSVCMFACASYEGLLLNSHALWWKIAGSSDLQKRDPD